MKIRQGFVSNSSSSSFICNVCKEIYEGWDGEYDIRDYECLNGHCFCECCEDKLNEKLDYYVENFNEAAELLKINLDDCDGKEKDEIIREYMLPDRSDVHPLICPICNFTYISDRLIETYLIEKYNLNKDDIINEIREKYKDLKEWSNR